MGATSFFAYQCISQRVFFFALNLLLTSLIICSQCTMEQEIRVYKINWPCLVGSRYECP